MDAGRFMSNDVCSIAQNVGSLFFGGLITWYFSWLYYRRAGLELTEAAKKLNTQIEWIQKFIENMSTNPEFKRDASGQIESLLVNMSANLTGSSKTSADLTPSAKEADSTKKNTEDIV